jgi:hypothetical protein
VQVSALYASRQNVQLTAKKLGVETNAYDPANRLTSVNGIAYTWDDNPLAVLRGLRPLALQRGLHGNLTNDRVRSLPAAQRRG